MAAPASFSSGSMNDLFARLQGIPKSNTFMADLTRHLAGQGFGGGGAGGSGFPGDPMPGFGGTAPAPTMPSGIGFPGGGAGAAHLPPMMGLPGALGQPQGRVPGFNQGWQSVLKPGQWQTYRNQGRLPSYWRGQALPEMPQTGLGLPPNLSAPLQNPFMDNPRRSAQGGVGKFTAQFPQLTPGSGLSKGPEGKGYQLPLDARFR